MSADQPSHERHRREGPASVACRVITVSDTRSEADDASGALIVRLLEGAGHSVRGKLIVADEPKAIAEAVEAALADEDCRALILTGGTGISPRDRTIEVVEALCEKPLPGFGELFRMLSWEEIGAAAMLSRATAGAINGKIIMSVPGSRAAVKLAMEKLILPELGHLVRELGKKE